MYNIIRRVKDIWNFLLIRVSTACVTFRVVMFLLINLLLLDNIFCYKDTLAFIRIHLGDAHLLRYTLFLNETPFNDVHNDKL